MRTLGGLILLAGIGVALFVYLPAPVDSGGSLDRVQRVATSRSAQLPPAEFTPVSRQGSFSPSVGLSMPARQGPRLANETTADPALAPPQPAQAPIASDAQTGWQTTVISGATPAPTELTPRDPDARYKLVLDIQQQLRRVGCYWGRIDGSWGYATQDAMKEFTDRVNATLPLDQPDYVQLTLIQSQGGETCGACPAGQSLSKSGRCVGLPLRGEMVAAAQKDAVPGGATALLLFRPVQTTMGSAEPVLGRMALGASVPTTVDVQQSAPPVVPKAAAAQPGTMIGALGSNGVKAVMATPKSKHRSSSSNRQRASPDHGRHFVGDYGRMGSGTPRHNLLLTLGGLY